MRGRITPIESLVDLEVMAGNPRRLPNDSVSKPFTTTVQIANVTSWIAADGTFVLGGIQAGTWDLGWWLQRRSGRSTTSWSQTVRKGLILIDGETVDVDLDVAPLLPVQSCATVMLDGVPFKGTVSVTRLDQPGSSVARSDTAGRIDTMLAPGVWTVRVQGREAPGMVRQLAAFETVTLTPGQAAEAMFHVRTARAKLRVLAPDGTRRWRGSS